MTAGDRHRVCHVVGTLGSGGRESLLLDIVENSGGEVSHTVFSMNAGDSIAGEFERAGAWIVDGEASSHLDLGALYRLYRFLRRNEFDVLHCHGPIGQVPGRLLSRLAGWPPVVSTHHIVREEHEGWMNRLERFTRALDATTVAVSDSVLESYSGGDRWQVVQNGIDVESFRSDVLAATPDKEQSGESDDRTVYLNVGRYIPQKAQIDLVDAMAILVETHPRAHLYVVGGRGDMADELRERAREKGVADNVTITGRVPSIEEYYARAEVYVSSSLNEGLPIVLLEAMAAGLPVVATDVPGNSDVVVAGETGLLVEPNDSADLATAMDQLADPDLQQRYGDKGLERVRDLYSIERTVAEYVSLYREVAGNNLAQEGRPDGQAEVRNRG